MSGSTRLKDAFLHRKEATGRKPLSLETSWLLDQCSKESSGGRFYPLSHDPSTRAVDTQSYTEWKVAFSFQKTSHPLRTRRNTIILQPLSYASSDYSTAVIEPQVMTCIQGFCQAFFHGVEVVLTDPLDISTAKKLTRRVHQETKREQVLVDDIVKFLKVQKYPKAFCVIGVTIVDLYPGEEWNFTLGQANSDDGVAVCSFGRYFNSQPTPLQQSVLQQQMKNMWILVRVLSHELCHLYGLGHCFYFRCAMNESNSIAQAAQQPLFLCPICLRKLHKVIKFDLKERYLHLVHQCNTLRELLQSYDTSPDDYPDECSTVSTNDTHTSEHACTSTSVDLMTGSSDHVSSLCAGDMRSSSSDAVSESTKSSSVEQQQNSSPHGSGEVLQSPTAHFTHAVEWLHTTVTSLSNFIEHNNIHKKSLS